MPVTCYHFEAPEFDMDERVLLAHTYSLGVMNTNLESVLRLVAPSSELLGHTLDFFTPGYRFRVEESDIEGIRELFRAHGAPTVTAITNCDVSVCLDWYQRPDDSVPPKWSRTDVGALVYRAKYYRTDPAARREAGMALAQRAIEYVDSHPLLRRVEGVAAVPSSQVVGPAKPGLVKGVATLLARHLKVPIVNLERVAETPVSQKSLSKTDDPDANQAGTMKADGEVPPTVLLVDDLMRHGSTVNESARALRLAGVGRVYSVTLVKQRTGTKHYAFP